MRLSHYFLPILKETPAEAKITSHQLMLRAGLIRQLASGIYTWLPLGLAVLKKIEQIVREEMNQAGAVELLMPTIQPASLWQESGRYEDYGKEMLRIEDRHGHPLLFGPTNEEIITDIFRRTVKSYKDLPLSLYHTQWKFRDEIRPRFGVMRGREFLMKDAYSFDIDKESAFESYKNMFSAYIKAFKRMGLTPIPVKAETGPIGGNLSHEFHILANTGESTLYYDKAFEELMEHQQLSFEEATDLYAAADEMHNPETCPVPEDTLRVRKGIEVGHIFNFGTKYSKALNAKIATRDGKEVFPEMGSYGIGISRLVGGIIEASHDEHGIIWPEAVAPFKVGIINVKQGNDACDQMCETLYQSFVNHNISVLYNDRKEGAGSKFATQDLIGTPWQIAVGPKGLANGQIELKNRRTGEKTSIAPESALTMVTG